MKLSDIVDRINGNVDRFTTDLEYYIGGEHIDSNELEITRGGNLKENLGKLGFKFHFAFQDRDVIFMARNPHLRKAGMVMFSGLCSDASYILRSKDENVITQEFLAVQLQSDHFWDYCERTKVGSVNFANNWTSIANYEFELPSIDKQKEIAKKVWAAYNLKKSYRKLLSATQEMVKSQFIEMFGNYETNANFGDLFSSARNGANIKQGTISGGIPITRIETISEGEINRDKMGYAGIVDNTYSSYYLQDGDILVSHINSMKHIGKCALYQRINDETIIHGMNLLCLRPYKDIVNPQYVTYLLRSSIMRKLILDITKPAVNQASFTVKDLCKLKVMLPPISEQEEFVTIVKQADKSEFELRKSIEAIDQVIKSLINN